MITGAAGSIGAATARLFVAQGARVVLADVDEVGLHALGEELGPDNAARTWSESVTSSARSRS